MPPKGSKTTLKYLKNDQISSEKLRVIDSSGENLGVITREEALELARNVEMDLVLISPNTDIPVAKIIDWSKFLYEKNKKAKNSKGRVAKSKEWWFTPKITEHDMKIKLNNIHKFLKKGSTAKLTVKYMKKANYTDMKETLDKILLLSEEFSEPISEVTKEGSNLSILLKLKK